MRRNIPNMGALIAFESAARHESFTKAADELALTQSAVCRRIASLEDYLGAPLFLRLRRGVKLSEAGRRYARQVTSRLNEIERDALSLMAQRGQGATIELAVMPTFATRWLIPRLDRFYARNPMTLVNLTTQTRPFLFEGSGFDAALYCGLPNWPGTHTDFLMHEYSVPVCSPSLLGARSALAPEEIAARPLIQQATRPYAWREWFAGQGLSVQRDMTGMRMELFSMSAQAAILGAGVALIPPILIESELRDGLLAIAHPARQCDPEKVYCLIAPEQNMGEAPLRTFREWLLAEIRDDASSAERTALPGSKTGGPAYG